MRKIKQSTSMESSDDYDDFEDEGVDQKVARTQQERNCNNNAAIFDLACKLRDYCADNGILLFNDSNAPTLFYSFLKN